MPLLTRKCGSTPTVPLAQPNITEIDLRTVTRALILSVLVTGLPGYSPEALAEPAKCLAPQSQEIGKLPLGSSVQICLDEISNWEVTLHLSVLQGSILTVGSHLAIFGLVAPPPYSFETVDSNEASDQARITLESLGKHVWRVVDDQNIMKLTSLDEQYLVWSPLSRLAPVFEADPEWGKAEAKVFRCIKESTTTCVTYYNAPKCSFSNSEQVYPEFVVAQSSTSDPVEMIEAFSRVDAAISEAMQNVRMAVCGSKP